MSTSQRICETCVYCSIAGNCDRYNKPLTSIEQPACDAYEIHPLLAENAQLRELVRDYVNAPCTTCDCWDDNFRCWNYDGADCGLVARARELGVEVDG